MFAFLTFKVPGLSNNFITSLVINMNPLKDTDGIPHFLYPCGLFTSIAPASVRTILGSCVSVCIYDERHRVGGINHFMLPSWSGQGLASPKYGDIAIEKLIENMLLATGDRRGWVAKIFGGADQHGLGDKGLNVGVKNVLMAENILMLEKIPIISRDTGGISGRKIVYHTHTNAVQIKYLVAQET